MESVVADAGDAKVLQTGLECSYRVQNVGRGEAGIVVVVDIWSIVICFGQG